MKKAVICLYPFQSLIMPYKSFTQASGPKLHFTAVYNAAWRGSDSVGILQPAHIRTSFQYVVSLALKMNLLSPAPQLPPGARVTNHAELAIFSPFGCVFILCSSEFWMLQYVKPNVYYCSFQLCAGERTHRKEGEEKRGHLLL